MIMSYKNISSNTINRHRTGGIIMTELSRFQKDVEVAATALEMRVRTRMPKKRLFIFTGNSEVPSRSRCGWQLLYGDIFWQKK